MDNMLFSNMTLNPQPLHIDRHFCETETEWGQPLMNSLFTLGLMIGISVNDLTVGTTIANLGMTEVKFPHPLFENDTVHCTTEMLGKRESKSRPDAGIVELHHRAFKQDDTLVAECRRQAFMRKTARSGDAATQSLGSSCVLLFVPADSDRKLEKGSDQRRRCRDHRSGGFGRAADQQGRSARERASAFLTRARRGSRSARRLIVRVNALDTGLTDADLDAVVAGRARRHPAAEGAKAAPSVIHLDAKLTAREAIARDRRRRTSGSSRSRPRPQRRCSSPAPIAARARG